MEHSPAILNAKELLFLLGVILVTGACSIKVVGYDLIIQYL